MGRYVATVKDVEEVTLRGSAAFEPWADRLACEELTPSRREDGRVPVQLVACEARYMGITFRECSVSVQVSDDGDEVFLAQAYNSSRLFAWSERSFFRTPYDHADVSLDPRDLAHFLVIEKGVQRLAASMGTDRAWLDEGDERWEGTIHIPQRRPGATHEVFHAKLEGLARIVPFDAEEDEFDVHPAGDDQALSVLAASDFRGETWLTREYGIHARTKTRPR